MDCDFNDLSELLNILASTFSFSMSYARFSGKKRRMLIVEGTTDSTFIKKLLVQDVSCEVASNVLNGTMSMMGGWGKPQPKKFNCKEAIVKLIRGLAQFPPDWIPNCPEFVAHWDIYGMIDADYQDSDTYRNVAKLFVTDTSDLETLILSTDSDLLIRIEKLCLTHEEIKKAFTWAYQFAKVRDAIIEIIPAKDIPVASLLAPSNEIEYSRFISEEGGINILEMLKYMDDMGKLDLSKEKMRKFCTNIITKDKYLKKNVDPKTFAWVWSASRGEPTAQKDFWNTVKGHTMLNMLKYVSPKAALYYATPAGDELNRQFEKDLISMYDYSKFYSTSLCKGMLQAELVTCAS